MGLTEGLKGLNFAKYAVHHRFLLCPEVTDSKIAVEPTPAK